MLADVAYDATTTVLEIILVLGFLAVVLVPYWKIATKAGYSGWMALLMLVPLVNLVTLWIFAFSDWPKLRENRSGFTMP